MMHWAEVGGLLTLLIWGYLALFRGWFWKEPLEVTRRTSGSQTKRRVAAVIPARNEAAYIGRAVRSLLEQKFDGTLHVFVVDDNSSDATAQAARAAAEQLGASHRFTVLAGAPLPAGWSGKVWAMHQGVVAAETVAPDFLLLTDADVVHASESVADLVTRADEDRLDLVSVMVRLHCRSAAERLLIPAFVYFFFLLYPPRWVRNVRQRSAGAAGGCVLIRPEALQRAGGLAAIRSEVIDDCALAAAVKRSGGQLWLGLASRTESVRPYESLAEIGRMISRTAFNQLRHSTLALVGVVIGMAITFFLPWALLGSATAVTTVAAGCACLLMLLTYAPMLRFYRVNPLWALTLPVAALFYAGATVHSAIAYWSGRGGQWKGRVQDPAGASPK